MCRRANIALLGLMALCACRRPLPTPLPHTSSTREQTLSSEIVMSARWSTDPQTGKLLQITLTNIGRRTLVFDTGTKETPMAKFSFNLERPDRTWVMVYCQLCEPSGGNPAAYSIRLAPAQFLRFTLPVSTLVATDPETGIASGLFAHKGQLLIELQVPTPPGSPHRWPGYVSTTLPVPWQDVAIDQWVIPCPLDK